jgi:hypothetical protein
MTDREDHARQQHDLVIQRLFALGMELHVLRAGSGAVGRVDREAALDRVLDQLDLTIRDIRSALEASATPQF